MSVRELAGCMNVHRNRVYALLEEGVVFPNAFKIVKQWRIPTSDVRKLASGWVRGHSNT